MFIWFLSFLVKIQVTCKNIFPKIYQCIPLLTKSVQFSIITSVVSNFFLILPCGLTCEVNSIWNFGCKLHVLNPIHMSPLSVSLYGNVIISLVYWLLIEFLNNLVITNNLFLQHIRILKHFRQFSNFLNWIFHGQSNAKIFNNALKKKSTQGG